MQNRDQLADGRCNMRQILTRQLGLWNRRLLSHLPKQSHATDDKNQSYTYRRAAAARSQKNSGPN